MSAPKIQRTYGSKGRRILAPPSSPPSTLNSSPPRATAFERPSKRVFRTEEEEEENVKPAAIPRKRAKLAPSATTSKATAKKPKGAQQKTLTQLHFNIDQSILRTCPLCNLSYTKGAPDDEALHKTHCASVRQGLDWGREEEKERLKGTVVEVASGVALRCSKKKKGRILSIPADVNGRIGTKITALLQSVNLSLSAPELPASVLECSKVYIFLLPHETASHRERIVGCVVAQRISTAMAVVASPPPAADPDATSPAPAVAPVVVDSETNLFCDPEQLPTPMGIPRLFVSSAHRRLGIAQALLNAAAETFIHGCPLDPLKGQIAFSQPTGMGQAVMKKWGNGNVRVFEE